MWHQIRFQCALYGLWLRSGGDFALVNPFTKHLNGCKALLHTLVKYRFVEFLFTRYTFYKCLLFFSLSSFFTNSRKMQYNAISVTAEKVTAPIPIPKFGIGFGSRYRYRISVGHYVRVANVVAVHDDLLTQ